MARYIDIDNEKFWDILFDEACVEGNQAKRIEIELKSIVVDEKEIRTEEYGKGYNQGTIDRAEELQKCREYGYNKAIDEFVERARILCINRPIGCDCRENIPLYAHTDGTWHDLIADIAEVMKGGAE